MLFEKKNQSETLLNVDLFGVIWKGQQNVM